jgi:hypothetical protein
MSASKSRPAFLTANSRFPIVRLQYRDRPRNGRHYRLQDGSCFLLDEAACRDLPEKWPEDFR